MDEDEREAQKKINKLAYDYTILCYRNNGVIMDRLVANKLLNKGQKALDEFFAEKSLKNLKKDSMGSGILDIKIFRAKGTENFEPPPGYEEKAYKFLKSTVKW